MKIKIALLCISAALLVACIAVGFTFQHVETTPPPVVVTPPSVDEIESSVTLPPLDNSIQISNGLYFLESSTIPLTFAYTFLPNGDATLETTPHFFADENLLSFTATNANHKLIQKNLQYTATIDAVSFNDIESLKSVFLQAFNITCEEIQCVYNPSTRTITFTTATDTIVFAVQNDLKAHFAKLNESTVGGMCTLHNSNNSENSDTTTETN